MNVFFTFKSTHDSLKAEQVLKGAGIYSQPRPVPRTLSKECGLALGIDPADLERAITLLKSTVGFAGAWRAETGKEPVSIIS